MHLSAFYKKLFICAILTLQYGASFCQVRTVTGLNQYWQFTKGSYDPTGNSVKQTMWETVSLPHTWNKDDVNDDVPDYHRAVCWYRKTIAISSDLRSKNVYLYFEGADQITNVYVNGKKAGTHIGGYTAFSIQIDQYLNFDAPEKNEIAVEVDNRYNEDVPPLTADFTFYGGIYRNVNLIAANKVHFDMIDGGCGVYVTTPQVSVAKALVKVTGQLIKYAGFKNKLRVESAVLDADGKQVAIKVNTLAKDNNTAASFVQDIPEIATPHLWTPDDPYLYHITTKVYNADTKELLDEVENPLGFRWFGFDADKGFFLNDKPLKLIGASRHQDHQGLGNALPDGYHEADMKLLKAMGGNFLRVAHYPQSPEVLAACDRLGILATVEIPIVNAITESDAFTNNSRQMLMEMLHQNYNHPSLIIWGYMNEILLRPKFAGDKPRQKEYFANINKLAQTLENMVRKEDAGRYTMMACHGSYDGYNQAGLLKIPMIVGWNLYQGWYSGTVDGFGKFLDKFHKDMPATPTLVTEYGADTDPRIRSAKPVRFDKSVDYGLYFHNVYLDAIQTRPFIAGAMVWNLADFNSETREETMPHINNKGLLGNDRKPKDTYRFYQAELLTKPYIKLSDWTSRAGIADSANNNVCTQPLVVFSNTALVQLVVNGIKIGEKRPENGMATFNVPFVNGSNNVQAMTIADGKQCVDQADISFSLIPFDLKNSARMLNDINILLGAARYYIQPGIDRVWIADQPYKKGQFGHIGGKPYMGNNNRLPYGTDRNINKTDDDPVYQTQRTGLTGYKIDVPQGEYELTLHFAELVSDQKKEALAYNLSDAAVGDVKAQDRVFDVLVNGVVVLKDYNIAKKFGYLTAGYEKMRIRVADANGLNIEFRAIKGDPVLNAVQLKKIY